MKILQVCPRYRPYIGGVEKHVRSISERLSKKYDVSCNASKMHLFNHSKLKDVNLVGVADKSKKNRALVNHLGLEEAYLD